MKTPAKVGRLRENSGLTVVEIALLLSIVGVLLAVAIPTFFRTVRTSKVAEASLQLTALYQTTAAYYDASAYRSTQRVSAHCLPPSAGPTPDKPSPDPVKVDFFGKNTPGSDTWRALDFQPDTPLRYRYTFRAAKSGCELEMPPDEPMVILRAEGDIDADGEYSTFERSAYGDKQGELTPSAPLLVRDRLE
jgi:type II secretory pathway pseudopilin PulG